MHKIRALKHKAKMNMMVHVRLSFDSNTSVFLKTQLATKRPYGWMTNFNKNVKIN